jgi:integrase
MARSRIQKGSVRLRGRKRGKDVWTIRYRVRSGAGWVEKVEAVPKAKNESDARRVLDRRMLEINTTNDPRTHAVLDFAGFVSGPDWQGYVERRRMKPSTRDVYKSMLNNIALPALGDCPINEITPQDISRLLDGIEARGGSRGYVRNVLKMLKVMFNVAWQVDLVDKSPVRPKLHQPIEETKKKPTLTPEQIRRVEEGFPVRLRALCVCAALTGLRLGELLGLRWSDIDFSNQTLTVSHSLYRGKLVEPKTESTKRQIRMSSTLAGRLLEHRQGSKWTCAGDFIFVRDDGSPELPDGLRKRVLYPAMDAAGITRGLRSHGFHIFRHSAASILYAERGDLKQTQEFLGHAQIATTADVYTHMDVKVIEQGVETLAEAIWPGPIEVQGSDRIQ